MPMYSSLRLVLYSIKQHFSAPQPSTASVITTLHPTFSSMSCDYIVSTAPQRLHYIPLNNENSFWILGCSSAVQCPPSAPLSSVATSPPLIQPLKLCHCYAISKPQLCYLSWIYCINTNSVFSSIASGPWLYHIGSSAALTMALSHPVLLATTPYVIHGSPAVTLYPPLRFTIYTTFTAITPAPLLSPLFHHT